MNSSLQNKIVKATKWSTITELSAKLVTPISTIILARLLSPDAFGVLVTVTMIISFAEIFTDAGFQKYLVQHEFLNEDDKFNATTVAFWSNFLMSLLFWGVICLFRDEIAHLVGCDGLGLVVAIASSCIPLAAFSSIQMALYKRDFDFKTLFVARLFGIMTPLIVTIPIAYLTRSYWALVVGMIFQNAINALVLTVRSPWKPNLFFRMSILKKMLSFSIWSMIEAVSIWLTSYVDIFIVGTVLNQYYLGIYRTSMTTVGQIIGIVASITTPVLFSALSRLQNSDNEFQTMFFKFQKIVGILVVPLGFGIYLFRELVVGVILGEQWGEAAYFIGLWGLTGSLTMVLSHYCSEVYRAKGKPKLSVLVQILHIIVLWPTVLYFVNDCFDNLCLARSLVRLELILANLFVMYFVIKMKPIKMILNVLPSILASLAMLGVVLLVLPPSNSILIQFAYIAIAIVVYFSIIFVFPAERNIVLNLKKMIKRK